MENKLKELTDKIYEEGLEKAKADSSKIVSDAEAKAKEIIETATKKAEEMISDARKSAEEIKRNSANDVKMAGDQTVAALKQKIYGLVSTEVLNKSLNSELKLGATLKEVIVKLLESWKDIDNAPLLDIVLSDEMKETMNSEFMAEVKNVYGKELRIEFTGSIKAGFVIKPQDGSFILSFTDEDFLNLFKAYLRPNTINLLFNQD